MMRIFLMVAGAVAMIPSPGLSAPTASQGASASVDFCKNVVLPSVPQANLGECVSYGLANDNGFSSHECDAFREIDPVGFYSMFDSYSDCVRQYKIH